jgi:hypothetical protein
VFLSAAMLCDMNARMNQVAHLREEISAIVEAGDVERRDIVVVLLNSGGGLLHQH